MLSSLCQIPSIPILTLYPSTPYPLHTSLPWRQTWLLWFPVGLAHWEAPTGGQREGAQWGQFLYFLASSMQGGLGPVSNHQRPTVTSPLKVTFSTLPHWIQFPPLIPLCSQVVTPGMTSPGAPQSSLWLSHTCPYRINKPSWSVPLLPVRSWLTHPSGVPFAISVILIRNQSSGDRLGTYCFHYLKKIALTYFAFSKNSSALFF